MAKVFPDIDSSRVIFTSRAEEQVYQLCKTALKDPWRVYYSATLTKIENEYGLKDNEIDFVLYHPEYGVIVLEVKGGHITYDPESGGFSSINRHNEEFSIKDPFKQALVWKSRFLRYLKKKDVRVPVCHGVCFPLIDENKFPESVSFEHKIIIGRNRLNNFDQSLQELAKASHPEKYLSFKDVSEKLDETFRGSHFASKLYLRDYIDSHELRVKDIESIQDSLVTPIASSQKLGVEGEAGTGKTILAILLAKYFRDEGKKVCLLSSNRMLGQFLKKKVGDNVRVSTYTDLASDYGVNLLQPPKAFEGSKEDWTQVDAPELLRKRVSDKPEKFDILICDEAQDVQPYWWEAFDSMLTQEDPRFYLFFDRSQGVFGSGSKDTNFLPDDVLPVPGPYFPLVNNYRNTREIASFSRTFRTGKAILQSHCGRLGYVPEVITYKDAHDMQSKLGALIRRLTRSEKIRLDEITLLSGRAPQSKDSTLYNIQEIAKTPLHYLSAKSNKSANHTLGMSTITGFKGLETPIGILINLSEYHLPITNPIMSSLVYVAATRAKHMLYVFLKEGDSKLQKFTEALDNVAHKGAMIIEGSQSDFEFAGVVTHYNPERVGWLSVPDPAFQDRSIMFFPSDVKKAGIDKLKKGDKLIFRPMVEGAGVTIAASLRLP